MASSSETQGSHASLQRPRACAKRMPVLWHSPDWVSVGAGVDISFSLTAPRPTAADPAPRRGGWPTHGHVPPPPTRRGTPGAAAPPASRRTPAASLRPTRSEQHRAPASGVRSGYRHPLGLPRAPRLPSAVTRRAQVYLCVCHVYVSCVGYKLEKLKTSKCRFCILPYSITSIH